MILDHTHDPDVAGWVPGADGHPDFGPQNLPWCVFATGTDGSRVGTRIGDHLLDVAAVVDEPTVRAPDLNRLLAAPAAVRRELRHELHDLLTNPVHRARVVPALTPIDHARLLLPARIGDYSDFYAGRHHAEHVGALFRPDDPLPPNYDWLPIGYHGRASTVRVSGTPVVRPHGQLARGDRPVHAPTEQLDHELELAVWLGASPTPGHVVGIDRAAEQIAGFGLLNDWSARDVQSWEYRPLGPFVAKSFATTVSPYVITPEALAPFRVAPAHEPAPLPYLDDPADRSTGALAVDLEVSLSTTAMRAAGIAPAVIARSSTTELWWTPAQLVAHHASGGCELRAGDLFGSGTISTAGDDGLGCLLELTRGGTRPVSLPGGETRTFLADGDEVVLRARATRPGAAPVGFGECRGRVEPAGSALPAAFRG